MNGIKLGEIISTKRREKGITQEDLAAFIGVSKAAVSKWETDQSYPDIILLPQLASFFNISVDDLLGYQPQLYAEDIKRIHDELALAFAEKTPEQALNDCHVYQKKYFSCYPFLLQLALLYINHYMLFPKPEEQRIVLLEAIELCQKIKKESDDVILARNAITIEALGYLVLKEANKIIDILGDDVEPTNNDDNIIAQAYMLLGNQKKAEEILEASIFQMLVTIISYFTVLVTIIKDDEHKAQVIINKTEELIKLFDVKDLAKNTCAQFYHGSAQVYSFLGKNKQALEMLKQYTNICENDFFKINFMQNELFDCVENWVKKIRLHNGMPRNEKVIRQSMLDCVLNFPLFDKLKNSAEFKNIICRLEIASKVGADK